MNEKKQHGSREWNMLRHTSECNYIIILIIILIIFIIPMLHNTIEVNVIILLSSLL